MASQSTERRHKRNLELYRSLCRCRAGTPVLVQRANGEVLDTVTESLVFLLNGGAYVRVRGIHGNTALHRVSLKGDAP